MKRLILASIFSTLCTMLVESQPRNSYITIGYIESELKKKGEDKGLNNRYGMSLSAGYTYFLNKTPKLGSLYFGLDWTYLYGSFRQYRIRLGDYVPITRQADYEYATDLQKNIGIDQSSIGMQFGLSATSIPVKDLQMSTYFRYAPTIGFIESAIDPYAPPDDIRMEGYVESVSFAYTGYYSIGFSASYKIFMGGIEYKWSSVTHDVKTASGGKRLKFETSGIWFNIGVRLGKKLKRRARTGYYN